MNGLKHGNGTIDLKNGLKYTGQFRSNHPNGNGTMTYPDGRIYSGEFNDNRR